MHKLQDSLDQMYKTNKGFKQAWERKSVQNSTQAGSAFNFNTRVMASIGNKKTWKDCSSPFNNGKEYFKKYIHTENMTRLDEYQRKKQNSYVP